MIYRNILNEKLLDEMIAVKKQSEIPQVKCPELVQGEPLYTAEQEEDKLRI